MNKVNQDYSSIFENVKQKVCDEMQLSIVAYQTWIEPMKFYKVEDDTFYIEIPSEKAQLINYLTKNYKDIFHVCISDATDHDYNVKFIIKKDEDSFVSSVNSSSAMSFEISSSMKMSKIFISKSLCLYSSFSLVPEATMITPLLL